MGALGIGVILGIWVDDVIRPRFVLCYGWRVGVEGLGFRVITLMQGLRRVSCRFRFPTNYF